ncbi:MAG: LysR family transcriptional regulator [Pyramidobacter sp.]|nr:LysR family transcriptional regulator [Pyramidobacter sp.]
MEAVGFREMELILAVSEERSFTRAAEKNYISQPALSKIVRRVERNLGAAVFDRGSSPLRVTPEGERFLDYFRRMQALRHDLENYCGELRRRGRNSLTVGAPAFFCAYMLPSIVSDFQAQSPDFAVKLIETSDAELRELLLAGVIDAGLTVEKDLPPELNSFVLKTETIALAVPRGNPIVEKLRGMELSEDVLLSGEIDGEGVPRVSMKEFAGESFLFLKEGNDIRERGLRICRDAGFEPKIAMELSQLLTAYHLAESGLGVTFTRASIPYYAGISPDLRLYAIDHPDTRRQIRAVFSAKSRSEALPAFADFLRKRAAVL